MVSDSTPALHARAAYTSMEKHNAQRAFHTGAVLENSQSHLERPSSAEHALNTNFYEKRILEFKLPSGFMRRHGNTH